MKTTKMVSISLLLGLFVVLGASVHAQDAAKSIPKPSQKVLVDNESVRVIEADFPPGSTTDWHSHPNQVVYALTDGKLEITDKDMPARIMEFKAGTAMYATAVTHISKNIGTTTLKLLVTELKPATKKK
jgi:quercetin dioxygenase-like cupin family protein